MSDDDKIRSQLLLDVVEFGRLLAEKFDGYRGESNYDSLRKLVEDVIKEASSKDTTLSQASTAATFGSGGAAGVVITNETNGVAVAASTGNNQVDFVIDEAEADSQII
jgi:hypothetical protein